MNLKLAKKTCLPLFMIACIFVSSLTSVAVVGASPPPTVSGPISDALDYLDSVQTADGCIGGFNSSTWAVNAIVAAGEDPDAGRWANTSGYSIVDYLIDNRNQLNNNSATDLAQFILAMEAARRNSSDIAGTDYVTMLKNLNSSGQLGSTNQLDDDFWGIIALISAGESPSSTIIQDSVTFIQNNQNSDGGWSWSTTGSSDVDDTAAAIMALICAGKNKSSQTVVDAIQYLRNVQFTTGGFSFNQKQVVWLDENITSYDYTYSNLPNSISGSLAIDAIVAVEEHPGQWPFAGPSAVEHLLSLQNDDGSFSYKSNEVGSDLVLTTSHAVVALCYCLFPVGTSTGVVFSGDFTGDNMVDFADISHFVNAYIAYYEYGYVTVPEADFNEDGIVDFADISRFVNYYIGYYTDPISVDFCLDYQMYNGSIVWYNGTLLPAGSNLKELTEAVAIVNATWWPSYLAFFIDGINGVWTNESAGYYWMWTLWDEVDQQWEYGQCGADWWPVSDGEILRWRYEIPNYS